LTSGGLAAVSSSAFAALYSAFGKYDVVHIHAEGPAFFAWLPKMFGKRVVVTVHGIDWQREKWQSGLGSKFIHQGEKNAAKYADEVIVLSKGVQDYFKETYGRKTHFIPNGVNRPQTREAKLITDKFGLKKDSYILFLGRLVPEKGIRYLVEAFKNVKTDKKLVIAGGSSDTDSFMEELKELAKGDDRILFTGFVQGAILITPFVSLYTGGISDIDYYQPLFATLLCLAEYVYCTSLTYNNMIMAAGHIKQTQWISVTEAIINIVLSLILVKWIGIIGVALGTLIAFAFNTVANIVYMKKYIFDMSLGWIIKVYLANLVAGVLAMCLFGNIVNAHITGFISFFIWAAVVFAGVCLIDVVLNYFFFKNETKTVLYKIGKKFAR